MRDENQKREFEEQRQHTFHSTSTANALRKLALNGHTISTIVDIGASNGAWSKTAKTIWPGANALLFEANPYWLPALDELVASDKSYQYILAAAGATYGSLSFATSEDPHSGAVVPGDTSGSFSVDQVTIDGVLESRQPTGNILMKFDTHGYEREILAGARRTLAATDVIVMEMYLYQADERRFPAMCLELERLGFRCVDMCELLYRDYDFGLWQFDGVFVRDGSPETRHTTYY